MSKADIAKAAIKVVPRLVVFDLDMCVWSPEMFELQSAPKYDAQSNSMFNSHQQRVRLFDGVVEALKDIKHQPIFKDTRVAIASACGEKAFADACLKYLEFEKGTPIGAMVWLSEIYPGVKSIHFERLQKQSRVDFQDMLFFDDCTWGDNCADVERSCPGVVTVKTPKGLTQELWLAGLLKFQASKSKM
eukprot:CAMPEP_0175127070 /NCGR_PEP_ID=MMETSP0087-20121206/4195_1 /TAXON_ID=136419 /ORGANISM="Unknown Unknown, Strain D1" /LENGTH=188 /DNA_ID=CAMNT_0016409033 /DNA_START=9 /DNA_END=575 /DNA_ORIENTATION=-